ncbi:hypothetical protein ACWCHM_18810 [Micromonospora sp. SCSIO 07396]
MKPAEQVAALSVLVTLLVGVVAAVPAYRSAGEKNQSGSEQPISHPPTPTPTLSPPWTPSPSETPSSPPPTQTPASTTTPPAPPTPPVRFTIRMSKLVPNCSDVSGTGDEPGGGRMAVLFVRPAGTPNYFYEQPLHFDAAPHTWRANRVVVGDSTSVGKSFELHVYVVSDGYVRELAKHDGAPYSVPSVPGERLASISVKRSDELGNC